MKRNTNQRSRGQMEVFGLAVIIVIISIGFFIMVAFKAGEKPETPKKDYTTEQLPSNFVNSIANVQVTDCDRRTIKDLAIDCAVSGRIDCGIHSSCWQFNQSVSVILDKMLKPDNVSFRFFTRNIGNGNDLNITFLNCTVQKEKRPAEIIIPTYPVTGYIYLGIDICKQ